jgi:Na+/proline symporter
MLTLTRKYAAGATVQILMFSILACKTKMNAPRCHTYLEIIHVRYGRVAHIVFIFFALVTNILVGSQLLLGGSAVVTSLTGMNVYAAIFVSSSSYPRRPVSDGTDAVSVSSSSSFTPRPRAYTF